MLGSKDTWGATFALEKSHCLHDTGEKRWGFQETEDVLLVLVSILIILLIDTSEEAPSQDCHGNLFIEKTLQKQPENIAKCQLHTWLRGEIFTSEIQML